MSYVQYLLSLSPTLPVFIPPAASIWYHDVSGRASPSELSFLQTYHLGRQSETDLCISSGQVASSAQQRNNLQPPAISSSAYPGSPQLGNSSDISSTGLHTQYPQSYGYGPHPNEAPQYGYQQQQQQQPQQQPAFRTHVHTQLPPPHPSGLHSPPDARKRRPSEVEMPGSASSNHSPYGAAPQVKNEFDAGLSGSQGLAPMPKKGRTNTPWTPEEEMRLKGLRDQGSNWANIAKQFPARTEGSVKKHWYKDMHYAEFSKEDVSTTAFGSALHHAIKEYDSNKWKEIGKKLGKPAKACEQYAKQNGLS